MKSIKSVGNASVKKETPKVSSPTPRATQMPVRPPVKTLGFPLPGDNVVESLGDKFVKDHNLYYQTLKHPALVSGAKVPDGCDEITSAFTVVYRTSFSVGTNGIGAIMIGNTADGGYGAMIPQPYAVTINGSAVAYIVGVRSGQAGESAFVSTSSQLFSSGSASGAGSVAMNLPNWISTSSTIPSMFTRVRLVSAGMSLQSTAAFSSNGGYYFGASLPGRFFVDSDNSALNDISLNDVKNLPGSKLVPINKGTGLSLTYNPTDPMCSEFAPLDLDTLSPTDVRWLQAQPGIFVAGVDGATSGTSIIVNLILNYEGIPETGALTFVTPTPGVDDPLALAEALNARESDSLVVGSTSDYDGLHPESDGSHALEALPEAAELRQNPTGGMIVHSMGAVKATAARRSRRGSSAAGPSFKRVQQKSLFRTMLDVVLPAAVKVLPAVLAAL